MLTIQKKYKKFQFSNGMLKQDGQPFRTTGPDFEWLHW
jgi:hypothetical protein